MKWDARKLNLKSCGAETAGTVEAIGGALCSAFGGNIMFVGRIGLYRIVNDDRMWVRGQTLRSLSSIPQRVDIG